MVSLLPLASLTAAVVSMPLASAFVTSPVQPRFCGAHNPAAANPTSLSCSSSSSSVAIGCAGFRRPSSSPPTFLRATVTEAAASSYYTLDGKELRAPLTPVEDTVLIKVDRPKEMTEGGLYMPQVTVEKPTRGTVVATGEGKRHWDTGVQIPITVQAGDRVVFGNFDGTSVEYQVSTEVLSQVTKGGAALGYQYLVCYIHGCRETVNDVFSYCMYRLYILQRCFTGHKQQHRL